MQLKASFRRAAVAALVLSLAGCGTIEERCNEPQPYQAAESVPPLKVPEGLSAPPTRGALRIPDLEVAAAPREPGAPCLDEPPSFFPGRPKPGQAPPRGEPQLKSQPPAATAPPAEPPRP